MRISVRMAFSTYVSSERMLGYIQSSDNMQTTQKQNFMLCLTLGTITLKHKNHLHSPGGWRSSSSYQQSLQLSLLCRHTNLLPSRMVLSLKVRNSLRNTLEAPGRLKLENDVMFKGVASGLLACIHLNVHHFFKSFSHIFHQKIQKGTFRVMNQLNLICTFVLVVMKHLSFVEISLQLIQRVPITSSHVHSR